MSVSDSMGGGLLKIGVVIIRDSRRIRVVISVVYPHRERFAGLVTQLKPT